ncbi:hypothetical protein BCR39DRAFT_536914 [Naematelia encephala]|uniref:DUF221-domain-containing protein n=1 Tax=Naematelia encephala TaxID=71784 RepID=A0A1Y2AYU7_9TREE|nr:hypothetical protein BCR39DRAFT_536914 [Naematelia encephala]
MSELVMSLFQAMLEGDDGNPSAPPGSPPAQKFVGPWFSTQLTISLVIGVTSFLTFCFLRTRWDVVYMGRTKLKDFSPTPAHTSDGDTPTARFFGWIRPTLRTSEFTVLHTVGLDAAVLLNFFKMSFALFGTAAVLAAVVLMPLNLFRNGSTDSDPQIPGNDTDSNSTFPIFATAPANTTLPPSPSMYDVLVDPQTSQSVHLIFTYLFTFLCLYFFHRNFHKFVQSRQAFALHLIHSVSARTVLVTDVPRHLRGDRALADYFEGCGWEVESVSVCREVEPLRKVLEKRTVALLKLETAWAEWVGNPASLAVKGYDVNMYSTDSNKVADRLTSSPQRAEEPLIPGLEVPQHPNGHSSSTSSRADVAAWADPEDDAPVAHGNIHTTRPRPTYRPRWFGSKVDAIDFWENKFRHADEEVKEMRKKGRFEATHVAFVTFEDVKDAQAACQVVHYPHHSEVVTQLAPEPRDVVWSHVGNSKRESQIRTFIIRALMVLLLLFWILPVTSLGTLLSYEEIKKLMPWLAKLINASPRLAAVVQNSLPSLAIVGFNSLLPFLLEWLSYQEGFKSRSGIEYSLMRKYHLFLLNSILFIFLTTAYWTLVKDLADTPMKFPAKLAAGLQARNAKAFMISYVMLQALGLMPLQLVNLGPLFSLGVSRGIFAKTPRDYAEANAPPMLNYGWVYPQALLVFTVTLVYSVVSPLVLFFGAGYFGVAYLVYKYKLLFVYFKPYESNGEAWRISFARLLWGLLIFQVFMTGLFSLQSQKDSYWRPLAMLPLITYSVWWSWTMFRDFGPLSTYLALSSICEVQRGEGADEVAGVEEEGPVTRSQSNLNHRRYAVNDETLYVAPSDKRTDYSQPPMNNFYYGVLNTGRRRYAHPALTGKLPQPWLPAKDRPKAFGDGAKERRGIVLSLRRKMGGKKRKSKDPLRAESSGSVDMPDGWTRASPFSDTGASGASGGLSASQMSNSNNPWQDPTPGSTSAKVPRRQISFDPASGVIALPDEQENVWGDDGSSDDEGEGHKSPPESPVSGGTR